MSKEMLKVEGTIAQRGRCALSKKRLPSPRPEHMKLVDTDRKIPKAEGGTYTNENTRVVTPQAHMERHGSLRERPVEMEKLKTLMDDRGQIIKLYNKINNQLLANERRTDKLSPDIIDQLKAVLGQIDPHRKELDKQITNAVKELVKIDQLAATAIKVKSIGPITVAACAVYIDLAKADHASSLWAYVGLDKPSHKRYEKGKAGGGNKTLRTILYTMADSQVKGRGPYRVVYDQVKARLEKSEKMVQSRNTEGKLVECMWKDTKPCHRHGAALRAVMKHFLADYWMVGRTLGGMETSPLYPEAILGHGHKTISPKERGWDFK